MSLARRAARVCLFCGLAVAITWGISGTASAQETRFDVQNLNPMPSQTTNYFGYSSATVLEHTQWEVGLFVHYAHNPLVLRKDGERTHSIVSGQLGASLLGSIGLFDIVEIGIDVLVTIGHAVLHGNCSSQRIDSTWELK